MPLRALAGSFRGHGSSLRLLGEGGFGRRRIARALKVGECQHYCMGRGDESSKTHQLNARRVKQCVGAATVANNSSRQQQPRATAAKSHATHARRVGLTLPSGEGAVLTHSQVVSYEVFHCWLEVFHCVETRLP